MIKPALPENETKRLEALKRLRILETPLEERFDRITRIARRLFNVPIALITLVDQNRQWFKSAQGLSVCETSRDVSFCAHAILKPEPLVIPDASKDPRFFDNPLVTGEPRIRFYAGQPVKGPEGLPLGTICLIDPRPRSLSASELRLLGDLAGWVESELETIRLSQGQLDLIAKLEASELHGMVDGLTRAWNHEAILDILGRELEYSVQRCLAIGVLMADIDHFKKINDSYGHQTGDRVLSEAACEIRRSVRASDAVGRYGGEEFLVLLPGCDVSRVRVIAEKIRAGVSQNRIAGAQGEISVTLSLGAAGAHGNGKIEGRALIEAADKALYAAKHKGRNRVEFA